MLLRVELADVDPQWSLHYGVTFSADEIAELPATAFSLSVPHAWVLKRAGVPVG